MKGSFYALALAGLAVGFADPADAKGNHPKKAKGDKKVEKCWGINACKDHTACGVGKSDIEATKEAFGDKFAKSATHDCGGAGECAAAKGQLGWKEVEEGTCISKEKGFLIVKEGDKKVLKK